MALVTVSPVSESDSRVMQDDEGRDEIQEFGEIVKVPSPAKKRLLRQGSVSENFFAVKGAALILPRQATLENKHMEVLQGKMFGGDLKTHLYAICDVIRPQDNIKLVARLESWVETRMRYIVIVTTIGRQDTEESIILGMDFPVNDNTTCTIGLVIPIWSDTNINLDGDGGFKVTGREKEHTFKPVSVQAMWSALQALHKCVSIAQKYNYYFGSLYLTWTCYYESWLKSPRLFINEWEFIEDLWVRRPNYFGELDPERKETELKIRNKLKEVMMQMDLDKCTSRQIRQALEEVMDLDLKEYKTYIDTEMLVILGQMDTASKILDFLYLGSEWNASNLEELTELGITHILNITMEIDNFFPDNFVYKNIRCYDVETTDLLPMWNDTWKFIKRAQKSGGKCLVHCKMGISRSSATVSAFLMKENLWPVEKAIPFVKQRRSIICPNKGFKRQLHEYEGILFASAQRHNLLFRSRSESNLSAEHGNHEKESDAEKTKNSVTEQPPPTFDLNRRLLDLTALPYRSVHKRPKSWSPGEFKHCYIDDLSSSERSDICSYMNRSHMSEPLEITEKSGKESSNKRKKWRRRHTERIIPLHDFGFDSLAQSEDSIFVNPGDVPVPRIDAWMQEKSPKLRKNVAGRLSSPAALQTPSDKLTVDSPVHSSFISPMNSPSFKCTKNVSVSNLKSYFREEDTVLQVDVTASSPVILQADQSELATVSHNVHEDGNEVAAKTEDDSLDETKTVTESVISSCSSRERSLSETHMFNVKNMVSEIESRYSTENGREITEASRSVAISRSQSLTTSHSRCSDLSLPPLRDEYDEETSCETDATITTEQKNKNFNENNNTVLQPSYPNTTVIEIDLDSENKPHLVKTMSQSGCSIKENISASDLTISLTSPTKTDAELKRKVFARTLTQSELHVIREVGKTFLTESDDADSELLSECSSPSSASTSVTEDEKESTSFKKRGVVRRMAKMIEHKIKKQTDKRLHDRQRVVEQKYEKKLSSPDSTMVINKLLMGESALTPGESSKDTTVESIAVLESKSTSYDPAQSKMQDLLSLVAPTPYSSAHTSLASVKTSSVKNKNPIPIRRTQSERSFVRPIKTFFRSFREKPASQSKFAAEEVESSDKCSPVAVKQRVKHIENMGDGSRGNGNTENKPALPNKSSKALLRSNSNPYIAQRIEERRLTSRPWFSSKSSSRRIGNHRPQFYRNNNLYSTM